MESDDCSVPSEDEDNGGQDSLAKCEDETSYVSQHMLQPRTPSIQSSESEYRSVIPNKRTGGEYSSNCASKSKIRDQVPNKIRGESGQQSGSVVVLKPPSECTSDSSGRSQHTRLLSEPSKKSKRPVDGGFGCCNNQERNDRSDIEQRGEPHTTPSEPSSRAQSRPPSKPSCNTSTDKDEVGEIADCLEDPLVKRKVRVGDLASLLAGAQSKAW